MKKIIMLFIVFGLISIPSLSKAQTFKCPDDWICYPRTINICPIGYTCIKNSDIASTTSLILNNQIIKSSIASPTYTPTPTPTEAKYILIPEENNGGNTHDYTYIRDGVYYKNGCTYEYNELLKKFRGGVSC